MNPFAINGALEIYPAQWKEKIMPTPLETAQKNLVKAANDLVKEQKKEATAKSSHRAVKDTISKNEQELAKLKKEINKNELTDEEKRKIRKRIIEIEKKMPNLREKLVETQDDIDEAGIEVKYAKEELKKASEKFLEEIRKLTTPSP